MKRKTFYYALGAFFAVLAILVPVTEKAPFLFSSVPAFPFEQISAALRALSLAGNLGSGFALALCIGISLLPSLLALKHLQKKTHRRENIVLFLLSVLTFCTLLCMTNPAVLRLLFPYVTAALAAAAKAALGGVLWAFIILWFLLRIIRLCKEAELSTFYGYLRTLLYVLCFFFAAWIALVNERALLQTFRSLQQPMDGVMGVLRFLADSVPYVLNIGITFSLLTLFDALLAQEKEKIIPCATALFRRSCIALGVTAAVTAGFHLLQILFSRFLSQVFVRGNIPIISLAFTLLLLLVSRLVIENRRLKNDNDLFI